MCVRQLQLYSVCAPSVSYFVDRQPSAPVALDRHYEQGARQTGISSLGILQSQRWGSCSYKAKAKETNSKGANSDFDSEARDKAYLDSEKQKEINFDFEIALDEDKIKKAMEMATTDEQKERARKVADYIEQVGRTHRINSIARHTDTQTEYNCNCLTHICIFPHVYRSRVDETACQTQ